LDGVCRYIAYCIYLYLYNARLLCLYKARLPSPHLLAPATATCKSLPKAVVLVLVSHLRYCYYVSNATATSLLCLSCYYMRTATLLPCLSCSMLRAKCSVNCGASPANQTSAACWRFFDTALFFSMGLVCISVSAISALTPSVAAAPAPPPPALTPADLLCDPRQDFPPAFFGPCLEDVAIPVGALVRIALRQFFEDRMAFQRKLSLRSTVDNNNVAE
jgi:hypothetical protein